MADISLNGTDRIVPDGTTVTELVSDLLGVQINPDGRTADGAGLGVAVAVDGAVVPRGTWSQTAVNSGQAVEVVNAVQGG